MYNFLLPLLSIAISSASEIPSSLYHVVYSGITMGYIYSENDRYIFTNPHVYSIGLENTHSLYSEGPLQVFISGDISLLGLNQNVFIPSGNFLLGYQYLDVFLGVGPRFMLSEISPDNTTLRTNIIVKIGYILDMQGFSIPIQFGYVPDIKGRQQTQVVLGFRRTIREIDK